MPSLAEITASVLAFWFERDIVPGLCDYRPIWFDRVDEGFDAEIRRRFLGTYERAAAGAFDLAVRSADEALAVTIVLDQFPRNMFRGTARQYASDAKALGMARRALAEGFDRDLPPIRRWFLYMPFQHSEGLADQRRSVALLRALGTEPIQQRVIESAQLHLRIIERFGRFPHRNQLLGRASSDEELQFLANFKHHHLGNN